MGRSPQTDRLRLRQLGRCALAALAIGGCAAAAQPPMADVHLHFNWDQEELLGAADAVARLRANDVVLAVVSSTPSANARKLRQAGGPWVLPILSPYIEVSRRQTWYVHEDTPARMRAELLKGGFYGIGEMHLIAGFGPRLDNPVFLAVLDLAREFGLPVLIHTDSSDQRYFEAVCRRHHDIRFQWAHAGGQLEPHEVAALMDACPNVWTELSARDPWHYGNLVDERGLLLPGWIDVIKRFPSRFMTGTDPVWNAHQMYRWYEADEGWDHYAQLNGWHRAWIDQLPEGLRDQVRLGNALRFYGIETPQRSGSSPAPDPCVLSSAGRTMAVAGPAARQVFDTDAAGLESLAVETFPVLSTGVIE